MTTTASANLRTYTLIDDGTLDTVIECSRCGHRERFNFDDEVIDITAKQRMGELRHRSIRRTLFMEACFDWMIDEHRCVED